MEILFYQSFIAGTLVIVRYLAVRHLLVTAWGWTAFTIVNLFFPPLILLQFLVIWGTFHLIKPRSGPVETRWAQDKGVRQSAPPGGDQSGRMVPATSDKAPAGILKQESEAMSRLGASLDEIHENAQRLAAVSAATADAATAFARERSSIETALESARFNVTLRRELSADPRLKAEFDQISAATANGQQDPKPESTVETIAQAVPLRPRPHDDPATATAIDRKFDELVADHAAYLAGIRTTLAADADLAREVRVLLTALGRGAIARDIARPPGPEAPSPRPVRIGPRPVVDAPRPGPVRPRRPSGTLINHLAQDPDDSPPARGTSVFDNSERARWARIRTEAQRRRIPCLVHFTQVANLTSIMTHGLVPMARADRMGLKPVINDADRWDGYRDAVSLSVGFPNYRMFWK